MRYLESAKDAKDIKQDKGDNQESPTRIQKDYFQTIAPKNRTF